jgi:3-deoxy-manno-octulosonate cytidylyltransferase (CMP-KDO synthetase)
MRFAGLACAFLTDGSAPASVAFLMSAAVIIPARLGSTRFPNKLLASETGRPLVQHVVDRVRGCRRVGRVIVAAAEQEIVEALRPFGTECRLTRADHASGTDRVAEVARSLSEEIIVNVQGDEPEIEAELVDRLIECLEKNEDAKMATASAAFAKGVDASDPNLVKVVTDAAGRALYFSRAVIPYAREILHATGGAGSHGDLGMKNPHPGPLPDYVEREKEGNVGPRLHVGVYAYRRGFLLAYASWAVSPLERTEKLEQLRALERGEKILVIEARKAWHGIDTAEQYAQFVKRVGAAASGGGQSGLAE